MTTSKPPSNFGSVMRKKEEVFSQTAVPTQFAPKQKPEGHHHHNGLSLHAQKQQWKDDLWIYLRSRKNRTYRAKALKLMDRRRKEFMFEVDEQDRYLQERHG